MRKTLLATALFALAGAAVASPVTYKIDPNHTDVIAQWNHFGFSKPSAHFGQADGTLVYDAANVAKSSVQVTLPLSGLNAFVPDLTEHLLSADFFDAAKFPSASFKSTRVEAAGEGRLKVSGELSLHGVTRPVVLDVRLNKAAAHPVSKRAAIGFDASTTIKRSDFGLAKFVPNVSDEVEIRITTEAMVPKPAQ